MKCVIFDLDGTLVDTAPDVCLALNLAFDYYGIAHANVIKSMIGPPAIEIIKKCAIGEHDINVYTLILNKFREIHDNSQLDLTKAMPNASQIIEILNHESYGVAIATNKPRSGVNNILKKFFPDTKFCSISCLGDKDVSSKFESIRSVVTGTRYYEYTMVGDTVGDILSAKENLITSVAYLNGYGSNKELYDLSPDYLINDLIELRTILQIK